MSFNITQKTYNQAAIILLEQLPYSLTQKINLHWFFHKVDGENHLFLKLERLIKKSKISIWLVLKLGPEQYKRIKYENTPCVVISCFSIQKITSESFWKNFIHFVQSPEHERKKVASHTPIPSILSYILNQITDLKNKVNTQDILLSEAILDIFPPTDNDPYLPPVPDFKFRISTPAAERERLDALEIATLHERLCTRTIFHEAFSKVIKSRKNFFIANPRDIYDSKGKTLEPVGYLIGYRSGPYYAYMLSCAVLPEFRRIGIATALIRKFETLYTKKKKLAFVPEMCIAAQHLLKKLNYTAELRKDFRHEFDFDIYQFSK